MWICTSYVLLHKITLSTLSRGPLLKLLNIQVASTIQTTKSKLVTMKMDTPEFRALFTPELKKVADIFQKYQFELRLAGGPVRDLIMGKQPNDLDFATTATPAEMKNMFTKENIRMINMQGEKHGTVTCRINDKENYEVTTLRIDRETDGRHAIVEFTRDWELDAERRDLTINSMFLGLDGTLYDYFNGRDDLEKKNIRFVGNAALRIQEDYLRILRYFRFYGRISDKPDAHEPETLRAIKENMHGLAGISGERIWVETKKILVGQHAGNLVRVMADLGVTSYLGLPDQLNTEEFDAAWSRCRDLDPMPMTLLPALLREEHQLVYKLMERLKLSRDELRLGLFILEHREDDMGDNTFRYCQDLVCDTAGKEPKIQERICELLKYRNQREVLIKFAAWEPTKFPVSGRVLLEMGVEKGPKLAKVLLALRHVWKDSGYEMTEPGLLKHVEDLKKSIT